MPFEPLRADQKLRVEQPVAGVFEGADADPDLMRCGQIGQRLDR
jgi:hypothetical protein